MNRSTVLSMSTANLRMKTRGNAVYAYSGFDLSFHVSCDLGARTCSHLTEPHQYGDAFPGLELP